MGAKANLLIYLDKKNISKADFYRKTGLSNGFLDKNDNISSNNIETIISFFGDISPEWIITGAGEMLRTVSNQNVHNFSNTSDSTAQNHSQAVQNQRKDTENILQTTQNRHLIPLYSDISSIGGSNEQIANMDGVSKPSEWIDTGDWFIEATFAIRHYGDSMVEYPNGCILALKEVANIQSLVWGCDYVIETEEYRITKRIQKGNTPNSITAYSSNTEAYPDGRLIHEPVDIPVESIRRIALVLGYVVKKYSSGMVYTIKK